MLNPIPAQAVNFLSKVDRHVLCSRYSECLEICLSKGWQGFSCSECSHFEFERPDDTDYWAEQSRNSRCLLMKAGYLPKWVVDLVRNRGKPEDLYADM